MFNIKRKRQYALNKLFNFLFLLGLLLAWASVSLLADNAVVEGLVFGIAALLFLVVPAIFTPFCYAFDDEGVSLCYLFLPVERYLWKDIYAIEITEINLTARASIFDFFYNSVFLIFGDNVGECRFYMKGQIRKSFRTKYLLEKYWDGTITGYLFEDVKKWFDKKRRKKQAQIAAHLTDQVVLMERKVRAETREWLSPFIAQANQYTLAVKTKYCYVTRDFKEQKSRPNEGYTYTLIAEIAQPNETDENRILVISVDLLYVRLGKTAFFGIKNKQAREELQHSFSDALGEIEKVGFDAYIS